MTIEENVATLYAYGVQSDISTIASAGGTSQRLRRVSAAFTPARATDISPEVRPDQQIGDVLNGPRSWTGQIVMPLATVACDDFFAAAMRNTWASGTALTQSDFTSLAVSSGVVTFGGGNPSTLGLRVSDIILFANMSVSGNNTYFRITALSPSTITVTPLPGGSAIGDQSADTSCAITVVGKKLINGLSKTALTFEENFPNADVSRLFKHGRIGGMQVQLPPSGACTVSFPLTGLEWTNVSGGSAPYFSAVTAASETPVLEMAGGVVRLASGETASVTGLDFGLNIPLTPNGPLVGRDTGTEVFYGRSSLSGNISFFLETAAQLDLFRSGTEIDFLAHATEAAGSFYTFGVQRVKLMGQQINIAAEGGVLVQSPFQGIKKVAAAGYDATTLSIQRSNS